MENVPLVHAVGLSILSTIATAQETVLTERSAIDRVGNWYFTNQSAAQINRLTDDLNARPIHIDVVSTNPMRFDVSLVEDNGVHAATWNWRFDMSEAGLNAFAEDTNSRVLDIETYVVGGQRRFAAIFKSNTGADAVDWRWGFDMSRDGLIAVYDRHNMRVVDIERYREGGRTRYAAVMVDNTGARESAWNWFRDQTLAGVVNNMRTTGMRVLEIERHGTGENTRYTTVLVPFSPGQLAWHYYGITGDEVKHMALRHGSRVIDLERAPNGRFDVQLLDNGISRSGDCDGRLAHFGDALEVLMKREAIPGAQIAVVKDNRLVYSCAYGLADIDGLERVSTHSLFRIMSVSKLLTRSALMHLQGSGELNLDDPMLVALGPRAPVGPPADARMTHATVNHLIDMDGGFCPRIAMIRRCFRPRLLRTWA
ncbi:serine hydrolase [Sulfitobacter sp. F26169L]|uniref:serine hydrolase domain-containing protein n=1 Tax=Sulfitobacter sp. F26169L TaxID=2996015 RepID=UPI0022608445|nr:serine hydrolase [Sulfitobacter sp. F26169L]MCX7566519.1 serine hydrolase [Sulfitobacter sp. F26169L]